MKVSVITVCYNSSQFIRSALESVLSQSYQNIEYIVIDGGSTDDTLSIVNEYKKQITHLISEQDKGLYDALNKGIFLASGDVIGILHSDDFFSNSDVISNVVNELFVNPDVLMVLGNVAFVQEHNLNKIVRFYSSFHFFPWKLRFGFMPAHTGAFIKKTAYEQVGVYNINYKSAADFDMFVRMLLLYKLPYTKLNKTLVRMRMGGVSTSGIKSYITTTKEILKSLNENRVYSNILMVLMRLPIKIFHKLSYK